MASRMAKILFIADSTQMSFRGSNEKEQREIDGIRRDFAPYLYHYEKAPGKLVKKLGVIAERLIAATPDGDAMAAMYEPRR